MRCVSRTIIAGLAAVGAAAVQAQEAPSGLDWDIALRGSYAASSMTGGRPALELAPNASYTLRGERTETRLASGGVLRVDAAGRARITDLRGSVDSSYQLDSVTRLDGALDASLLQGEPTGNNLPVNTLHAPIEIDAVARGSFTRDFGRVNLLASVEGERYTRGPTTLADLTTVDNAHRSHWSANAVLRTGYELTPLLSTFVEGRVGATAYDAPSPTLLAYANGRTYELRGGMNFSLTVISAEASVGRAWLDYFDPALSDVPGWTYNGSVTFNPDETLSLTGTFETTLEASETTPGDTDLAYRAGGNLRYQVNPWVTLRASGAWDQTVTLGTNAVTWGVEAGAGLDYRSSRHIVWTADYLYARDYAPPAPLNDTHTVTVGVRVER